jgi:hypothetical protein
MSSSALLPSCFRTVGPVGGKRLGRDVLGASVGLLRLAAPGLDGLPKQPLNRDLPALAHVLTERFGLRGKDDGDQPVGLRQIDEAEWEVYFGPLLLGYVLMRNGAPVLEKLS